MDGMRFLDWTTCAVRVALPLLAPPCGWRSPNDLDRVVRTAPFMWNRRMFWCDVVANAAASAGSYGQRIERAEGFAQGMNRYPTLARAEIPTQVHIFRSSYSQTSWLLTRGGSESLGKSRLLPSIPKRRAFDGPDGGTG